jgi:hypothetical protein
MEVDGVLYVKGGLANPVGEQVGGGAYTINRYEPFHMLASGTTLISLQSDTSGVVCLFPFQLPCYVNAGWIGMMFSASLVTPGTSAQTQENRINVGLYTRQSGTDGSLMSRLTSQSLSMRFQISGTSSYRITHPMTTHAGSFAYGTTSSNASDISGAYTGGKVMHIPLNILLSPGQYWLAVQQTVLTTGFTSGFKLSMYAQDRVNNSGQPLMLNSTAFSTGTAVSAGIYHWNMAQGSYSAVGLTSLPNQVSLSAITQAGTPTVGPPQFALWSSRSF